MTEKEIKEKRKQCIKNEHFMFRMMILLGVISYKVSYRGDNYLNGVRWAKTYKTRWWHPITWFMFTIIFIIGIGQTFIEAFKEIPNEFKEKTFYC